MEDDVTLLIGALALDTCPGAQRARHRDPPEAPAGKVRTNADRHIDRHPRKRFGHEFAPERLPLLVRNEPR
jgi:hypothetical protein